MTCAHIQGQLAAYHEGGLLPAQRRLVVAHIMTCMACQAELASYDAGDRALRRLVADTPSEAIYASVLQHLDAAHVQRDRRKAHLKRSLARVLNVAGTLGSASVVGAVVVALAQGMHSHTLAGQGIHGGSVGAQGAAAADKYRIVSLHASGRRNVAASLLQQSSPAPEAPPSALARPLEASGGLLLYLRTTTLTASQRGDPEAPLVAAPVFGQASQALTLLPPPGIYSSPAVSPDGQTLAYGVHSTAPARHSAVRGIWVRPVDCKAPGKRLVVPGDAPDMQFKNIHWASDNRHLVFSVQTESAVTLFIADARTKRIVRSLPGWWPAWNQVVSPDLRLLAMAGSRHTAVAYGQPLLVQDLTTGTVRGVGHGAHPVWSPDSTRLAYLAGANPLKLVVMVANLQSRQHWQVTPKPQAVESLSWSPDGRALAYTTWVADEGPQSANQVWVVTAVPGAHPIAGLRGRWIGDFTWSPTLHTALR